MGIILHNMDKKISPVSQSDDHQALARLGTEIRFQRGHLGFSRSALAARSGVSLRFLAQLEAGEGNISYLRLRRVAEALGSDPATLIQGAEERTSRPLALLGMRGAGKSSVGKALARRMGVRFLELDELVEVEAGMSLAQIFELQGERYYRRLEREALTRFFAGGEQAILAVGGGIVTEPETFSLLQRRTVTIWLKAPAGEHWDRVLAQGDPRPMRDHPDAMAELERLWSIRARLYAEAHKTVDTMQKSAEEVAIEIEKSYIDRASPILSSLTKN